MIHSWALAPAGSLDPNEAGNRPNLSYTADPGAVVEDAVTLFNYGTAQLTFRKGRTTRLVLGKAEVTAPPEMSHDRTKKRSVPASTTWLRELGVTSEDRTVKAGMEAKYRQIHRFVELFQPLLADTR